MALNFLTEIALKAFITNDNGEYPATTPAICQDDYPGDLKPTDTSTKIPRTMPLGQTPFPWPDMNPKKRKSPQDEPNHLPGPANPIPDPEQSKKRPITPHPWENCNKCWEFGKHFFYACTAKPIPCPLDFKTKPKAPLCLLTARSCLGPLGLNLAQHSPTTRPSVETTAEKAFMLSDRV